MLQRLTWIEHFGVAVRLQSPHFCDKKGEGRRTACSLSRAVGSTWKPEPGHGLRLLDSAAVVVTCNDVQVVPQVDDTHVPVTSAFTKVLRSLSLEIKLKKVFPVFKHGNGGLGRSAPQSALCCSGCWLGGCRCGAGG